MENPSTRRPKYLLIADEIQEKIRQKLYVPGTKLPTDREMIITYNTSQATVTKAMETLSRQGIIKRNRRAGTMVTGPEEKHRKSTTHTIYITGCEGSDINSNRLTWFISDQILKGIVNSNTEHRLRIVSRNALLETVKPDQGPKAFINISPEILTPEEMALVLRHPHIFNRRRAAQLSPVNAVNYDPIISAYNGMAYLCRELGHRRVAGIFGQGSYHQDSLAGYRMALHMLNLPYVEELIIKTSGGEEEGYAAAGQLLNQTSRFTAVFCDTDLKAIGALRCCREHQLKIPEDISLIGSDDIPGVTNEYGLTTIRKPFLEMGREMLRLLEERLINKYHDVNSVTMYGQIVARKTCRPLTRS
jgi:DNA-binding LacI/PurR family transcriptional regulator